MADAKGSGTQRRYSYRDLVELKVIKSLLDAGVSLQSARDGHRVPARPTWARTSPPPAWSSTAAGSVLVRTDGELVDLVRKGQGVLNIVPLGGVVEELDAAIIELRPSLRPRRRRARRSTATGGG